MARDFREMLEAKWAEGKFVCVGLDSKLENIPKSIKGKDPSVTIREFNRRIVEKTSDIVCAYKPNSAFYEEYGTFGWEALVDTVIDIQKLAPDVPIILDAKRADIGNTNSGYVSSAFEALQVDAITVHPYLGRKALEPFLEHEEKGIFVLCRTSNPGADEFQDLTVPSRDGSMLKLYEVVAENVARIWNGGGNCGVVAGATYPDELAKIRSIVGEMPILIPGIGAQGGDLKATVNAGKDNRGKGMIINSSRGIIFASSGTDFAEAARRETQKLHDAIQACLK